MLLRLWRKLDAWERSLHGRFSHDIIDPHERKKSAFYVDWLDHGILRRYWTNHAEIAPGVFRSNHPNHERLSDLAAEGFKTILNLRGNFAAAHYQFEEESCAKLGLKLAVVPLAARSPPEKQALLDLVRVMGEIEKPFLMHCKSGADRAGLASAIYLLEYRDATLDEARKQLSPRFLHFRHTKTGILDHLLDLYGAVRARERIGFAEWVARDYTQEETARSFAARRGKAA